MVFKARVILGFLCIGIALQSFAECIDVDRISQSSFNKECALLKKLANDHAIDYLKEYGLSNASKQEIIAYKNDLEKSVYDFFSVKPVNENRSYLGYSQSEFYESIEKGEFWKIVGYLHALRFLYPAETIATMLNYSSEDSAQFIVKKAIDLDDFNLALLFILFGASCSLENDNEKNSHNASIFFEILKEKCCQFPGKSLKMVVSFCLDDLLVLIKNIKSGAIFEYSIKEPLEITVSDNDAIDEFSNNQIGQHDEQFLDNLRSIQDISQLPDSYPETLTRSVSLPSLPNTSTLDFVKLTRSHSCGNRQEYIKNNDDFYN